jgi:hypothetical protein
MIDVSVTDLYSATHHQAMVVELGVQRDLKNPAPGSLVSAAVTER